MPRCQALWQLVPLRRSLADRGLYGHLHATGGGAFDRKRRLLRRQLHLRGGSTGVALKPETQVVWWTIAEIRNKVKRRKINNNQVYSLPLAIRLKLSKITTKQIFQEKKIKRPAQSLPPDGDFLQNGLLLYLEAVTREGRSAAERDVCSTVSTFWGDADKKRWRQYGFSLGNGDSKTVHQTASYGGWFSQGSLLTKVVKQSIFFFLSLQFCLFFSFAFQYNVRSPFSFLHLR